MAFHVQRPAVTEGERSWLWTGWKLFGIAEPPVLPSQVLPLCATVAGPRAHDATLSGDFRFDMK
jgi:hypothetical protein